MGIKVNFIYLSVAPGVWCVLRVECDPVILSRLLDTICYKNVNRVPLSFDDYINRDYHYFAMYQIGSLVFGLSSRDPLRPAKFFKQFFRMHFVSYGSDK